MRWGGLKRSCGGAEDELIMSLEYLRMSCGGADEELKKADDELKGGAEDELRRSWG